MAFVSNMDDNPKQDKSLPPGPVSPTGGGNSAVRLSPSSAVPGNGGGGSAGPSPTAAGGQFASLNQYLDANQSKAEPLANKITSGIGQQYNTLQGQNTSTLNDINGQIAANATPSNANDILAQEAANPVSFAGDSGNVSSFQNLLKSAYAGPASAESTAGYTNQQNAINNAIASGQASTKTEAGRAELLRSNEAKPTTGVTALNSAILSQSPTALKSVESAYEPFGNLLTGLNQGAQSANAAIAQNKTAADQVNQQSNAQIQKQIGDLNTSVQGGLKTAQDTYNKYNTDSAALGSALQSGTLPTGYGVDQGLSAFINNNINPWLAANAPGKTASYNYANAVPQFATAPAPTANTAASAGDFATLNALNQLTGGQVSSPLGGLDPALAGSYKMPTLPNVDNKALAKDIAEGFSSVPAKVSTPAFNQFDQLMYALNKYQGIPDAQNQYYRSDLAGSAPTIG